jgi:hypothetical protein
MTFCRLGVWDSAEVVDGTKVAAFGVRDSREDLAKKLGGGEI